MSGSRKLRVDLREILDAMTLPPEVCPFLNLETGEVVTRMEDFAGEESEDELEAEMEEHPERYQEIPRREGREDYALMSRFAESIDEEDIRERLQTALSGRGAFGRFRDQVLRYPDIAERWRATQQEVLREEALTWLGSLKIDFEVEPLPPPVPAPPPTAPRKSAGPAVHLEHLLVLGAPGGKTEVLDGIVTREFVAASPDEARRVWKAVVRELCEYAGESWRNRFIEGKTEFARRDMTIRLEGSRVVVACAFPREILQAFGFLGGRG